MRRGQGKGRPGSSGVGGTDVCGCEFHDIVYKKERVPTLLLGERGYVFLLKFEQHHNVATYSPNEGNYIKQEQNLMMEEKRVVCECVRVAFSMPQREAMKHFIINVY